MRYIVVVNKFSTCKSFNVLDTMKDVYARYGVYDHLEAHRLADELNKNDAVTYEQFLNDLGEWYLSWFEEGFERKPFKFWGKS